jgi:hypothetical protein
MRLIKIKRNIKAQYLNYGRCFLIHQNCLGRYSWGEWGVETTSLGGTSNKKEKER